MVAVFDDLTSALEANAPIIITAIKITFLMFLIYLL